MSDSPLIQHGDHGAISCTSCGSVLSDGHPSPPRPLRVYLAGGSAERLTVCRPLLDALRSAGVAITVDWTVCPGWDRPSTDAERAAWALEDVEGVRGADLVWYVAPEDKSEGSHGELVAAYVLGKRIVASGPALGRLGRIFPLLAADLYATHREALWAIVEGL